MVSDRHVQLGTVHVLLDPTVRATLDTGPSNWLPLDIPFLTSDLFSTTSNPDGDDVVKILTHLLLDLGLGFCGEYELRGEEVIIRVALLPSDALGSEWRKTKSQPRARGREKWLGRLFRYLRQEWDGAGEQEQAGDGAYVMARTVSAVSFGLLGMADGAADKIRKWTAVGCQTSTLLYPHLPSHPSGMKVPLHQALITPYYLPIARCSNA